MVLYLALWSANYSNAQDVQTSSWFDLNNNTDWSGCYTQTSTPSFGGYSGGPCPAIANSGYMVFSYGQATVSQTFDLEYALQAAGTGLRINGYNYHWHVKNSNINGEQPGSYDPIAYIDVTLYNRNGSVAATDRYDYGYHMPEWQIFGGTRTYSSPYSLADVKDLSVSITAKDSGFWAGYYGPEFDHILVSVNYSVDPCASDPLYSPTCPGYFTALQSLVPAAAPTPETTITPTETLAEVQTVAASTPTTQQPATSQEPAQQPVASVEQKQEQSGEKKPGASLSTVLSIVRQEQARISSVEQNTVEASVSLSLKEADQTTAEAEAVAQQSSNQSQEQSIGSEGQQQGQPVSSSQQSISIQSSASQLAAGGRLSIQTSSSQSSNEESTVSSSTIQNQIQLQPTFTQEVQTNSNIGAIELKQPEVVKSDEAIISSTLVYAVDQKPILIQQNQPLQQQETSFIPPTLLDPIKEVKPFEETNFVASYSLIPERRVQEEIELPKVEELKVGAKTPADDFLEPKTFTFDQNQSQTIDSVKKPSQTNELAVGVSIDSLAITPAGYNQYNIALKDNPFYEPKEIYKGQKTVDNVRALRQLASDKLHQEMVEQQYRR